MSKLQKIKDALPGFNSELISAIASESSLEKFPPNTELLREGQYVKVIPVVLSGTLKVIADFDEKELLLYYIRPSQSCALSFSAALHESPSQIKAITAEETEVLLLPSAAIRTWAREHEEFNNLFFDQYQLRYSDLLKTIASLLFDRMDQRLLSYLREKSKHNPNGLVKVPHREIASELGTAREVISRVMKKLEHEGSIEQSSKGIKVMA